MELLVLADLSIPIDKVLASSWFSIRTVEATDLYRDLLTELDMGEEESIALAVELKADYLLIDEKKGRKQLPVQLFWIRLLRLLKTFLFVSFRSAPPDGGTVQMISDEGQEGWLSPLVLRCKA